MSKEAYTGGRESLFSFLRRRFVRWYMGCVAGRYCPCEWPIKSKRLMHLCGRIDDAYDRECFRDLVGFIMGLTFPLTTTATTSNSASNVTVTYTTPPRKRHGDKE